MRNNYDESIQKLYNMGYEYCYQSTYNGYQFSGTISDMQTRKGYDYKRVHIGKCTKGQHSYQITYVFRKKVKNA